MNVDRPISPSIPFSRRRSRRSWQFLRWAVVGLLLVIGLTLGSAPALGQFPLPQTQLSDQPPHRVERRGLLEATGVNLDGRELLTIASPTVLDRNQPGSQVPVEVRAKQIETNLNQLVARDPSRSSSTSDYATVLDPETLQVYTETVNGQPVLFVRDGYLAEPRVLLTVTDADAQYHGISSKELAKQWKTTVEKNLRWSLEQRQPEMWRQQLSSAIALLISTFLLILVIAAIWNYLGHRQQILKHQQKLQDATAPPTPSPEQRDPDDLQWLHFLDHWRQQITLDRRLQIIRLLRWLLFWAIAFIFLAGIAATLYRFPHTRRLSIGLISTPILILIAWFVAELVNRLSTIAIDRFAKAWETNDLSTLETLQRKSLRVSTIITTLQSLKTVLIYTVSTIWVLQMLDLAPTSLLAFGALLALAVSFAAQNLVKDLTNGFLILLEDQYAIGDYIAVNSVSGIVENLNLRVTQIRNDTGDLITIPNSQIAQVQNKSRTWSRCDYQIEVAYHTDVDHVLGIVREVAEGLARDPHWKTQILNPVELLGVEQISHSGLLIRLWMRTQPLQQWNVGRELRRRLKIAFDHHHIEIGIPQRILTGNLIDPFDTNDHDLN